MTENGFVRKFEECDCLITQVMSVFMKNSLHSISFHHERLKVPPRSNEFKSAPM